MAEIAVVAAETEAATKFDSTKNQKLIEGMNGILIPFIPSIS